jgi:hypothetical protein
MNAALARLERKVARLLITTSYVKVYRQPVGGLCHCLYKSGGDLNPIPEQLSDFAAMYVLQMMDGKR